MLAQNFIDEGVCYDKAIKNRYPNNISISVSGDNKMDLNLLTTILRKLVVSLRESIIACGLGGYNLLLF